MKIVADPQSDYMGLFTFEPVEETVETYNTSSGTNVSIVHTIVDWGSPGQLRDFQADDPSIGMSIVDLAQDLAKQNAVLAISWDPMAIAFLSGDAFTGGETSVIGLQDILNGTYDSYIRTVAQQVAGLDIPVMMNLFGESDSNALFGYGANGDQYLGVVSDPTGQYGDPALADGPERVKDVFKHIIDIFREEGADNATWFQYMATGLLTEEDSLPPELFYAGDDYIDWVGQSLYVETADGVAQSLDAGYNAWGAITDKPFFIPEMGLITPGGDQVTALLDTLQGYDRVGAYTWASFEGVAQDWGIAPLGTTPDEWAAIANAPNQASYALLDVDGQFVDFATWEATRDDTTAPSIYEGTSADDTLIGSESGSEPGVDILIGMAGNDFYFVDNVEDMVVENAGEGVDTVMTTVDFTLSDFVEDLQLDGTAAATLTGNALDNVILGNGAANVLNGMGGNDLLDGGAGADTMSGGEGDDVYKVDAIGDQVIELDGQGIDSVDSLVTFTLGDGVEILSLEGTGHISGTGNAGDNTLFGNAGRNTLTGLAGDDRMQGQGGNDRLFGGNGNDVLEGNWGADTLQGGSGDDVMLGGNGRDRIVLENGADVAEGGVGQDTFVYRATNALATISDFNAAEDQLDVTAMGFDSRAELEALSFDADTGVLIMMSDTDLLWLDGVSYTEFETATILV